jgi:hypothetical protein
VIAAAIIIAAIIIGFQIEQASSPESVKLEQQRIEQKEKAEAEERRLAQKNISKEKRELFFQDVFERIPESSFNELKLSEKAIYGFVKASKGYAAPIVIFLMYSVLFAWVSISEGYKIGELLKKRKLIQNTVMLLAVIIALSFFTFYMIELLALTVTSMAYGVYELTLGCGMMVLMFGLAGIWLIQGFESIYNYLNKIQS